MNKKWMNVFFAAILAACFPMMSVNAAPAGWYQLHMNGVPAEVIEAAQEAKPGIQLQQHRLTWRDDSGVYIVVGYSYGKKWRLNIVADGRVISVQEMDND